MHLTPRAGPSGRTTQKHTEILHCTHASDRANASLGREEAHSHADLVLLPPQAPAALNNGLLASRRRRVSGCRASAHRHQGYQHQRILAHNALRSAAVRARHDNKQGRGVRSPALKAALPVCWKDCGCPVTFHPWPQVRLARTTEQQLLHIVPAEDGHDHTNRCHHPRARL
jgi:hypothetical protein